MKMMRNPVRAIGAGLGVVVLLVACAPGSEDDDAGADTGCGALTGQRFNDATVGSAVGVASDDRLHLTDADEPLTDLPEFCRVQGTASPVSGSQIGFEVWLPTDWNGRAHMLGNGGYSSTMDYGLMAERVHSQDVAVATDTGHTGDDLGFGKDGSEAQADWGHRAVHESIVAAKGIAERFYGVPPEYSYFSGCSTGGHQGLMEAQRYPDDFDGIIAGAPGNNRTSLNLGFLWQFLSNHEDGDNSTTHLDEEDLQEINQAVVSRYDAVDGVEDGVITDPSGIEFDPVTLHKDGVSLTSEQIEALEAMYNGPEHRGTGESIYPGWPVGSEWVDDEGSGTGWNQYWANPEQPTEPPRADFFRHWAFDDPDWDWWDFDWDSDVDAVRSKLGPVVDATDPDLGPFQEGGGRLLMFTGWQDPVVSATDVIGYYEQMVAEVGPETAEEFSRLYMVPGMGHCGGGPGATAFSSSTQGSEHVPDDAQHDLVRAMERWVEEGEVPNRIVGTHVDDGEPAFSRPLCPHPETAVHRSGEDASDAASFDCEAAAGSN